MHKNSHQQVREVHVAMYFNYILTCDHCLDNMLKLQMMFFMQNKIIKQLNITGTSSLKLVFYMCNITVEPTDYLAMNI